MRLKRLEGDRSPSFDGLLGGVITLSLSFRLWGVLERGGELMKLAMSYVS